MDVVVFKHCIVSLVVLFAGLNCRFVSPITVKIYPDDYTWWERLNNINVTISCLLGADYPPITSITELRLSKDGRDSPLVRMQNYPQATLHVVFVNKNVFATAYAQLGTDVSQRYLKMTLLIPLRKDKGTYTCEMSYLDLSGEMREDSASKTLYVGHYGHPEDSYWDTVTRLDRGIRVVIYVIGIPGNIICLLVWIQKDMMNSSGFYLAVLSITDLLFICLQLVEDLFYRWGINTLHYQGWCQVFYVVFAFSKALSSPLALCFTVERYIAICYPFKRVVYCTVRRAKIVVACVMTFTLIFALPQGYFFKISGQNESMLCEFSGQNEYSVMLSKFDIYNATLEVLCIVVMNFTIIVMDVLIIYKLRQNSARYSQSDLASRPQRTKNISVATTVLLGISLYQVITTLPYTLFRALTLYYKKYLFPLSSEATKEDFEKARNLFGIEVGIIFAMELTLTQFSSDIIIYIITGKVFRQTLKRIVLSGLKCES